MGWLRLMNKIKSFLNLPFNKKELFIKTLILMFFIRICLTVIQFSKFNNISKKISKPHVTNENINDIIWSVNTVSLYVPKSTCLIQAITAQILLSRNNHPSKLKIGVKKKTDFEAHAWLEIDNIIVLGETDEEFITIYDSDT